MRIAALIPELAVNAIYRTLVPMQALAHRGHEVHVEERNEPRQAHALRAYDLVHFMRFYHAPMQRLARELKRSGVAVVWDNDDDLVTIPKGSPTYASFSGLAGQRVLAGMTTMMRHADLVTTPSEPLAQRYRELSGAEVRVLENYLPPTFTRPDRVMPHDGLIVGWLAALEHHVDADALRLRETLERLLARHQHVEVVTIGIDLGLKSRRYRQIPTTLYGDLPQRLVHFDVAIAPLLDIPFNRSRSNVKLKEYAALGVPWLASPTGPYAQMGEQQGGRLVPDDRWDEELDRLVREPEDRRRLGQHARRWAKGETIDQHAERWEQTFADAIAHARAAV